MKKIFMPFLLSLFLIFSFSTGAFAASIGDSLATPENGWSRIDDNNVNIKYIGNAWTTLDREPYYGGSRHQTESLGATIRFVFKGTKVRVISCTYPSYTNKVNISIDGVNEEFSELTSDLKHNTVVYEKTGLENKVHFVEISNLTSNSFIFDAIDIDADGQLLDPETTVPTLPESPLNLNANGGNAVVTLSWDIVTDAEKYIVKRSTNSGGPYTTISDTVNKPNFIDNTVINGTTYYYVVTAVNDDGESINSNEASATPNAKNPDPQPTGDRAILTVTMTTGLEKEFDLSISEVDSFMNWYDSKENGAGPAKYGIDKHTNNKGPFSKRVDYVIFKNILSFEVDEYTLSK